MKSASAPTPPDPFKTAGAQTGSNISTAIVNQMLQPNQTGPGGSFTNKQTGSQKWTDPSTGTVYDIPQMTSQTTLGPGQQQLYNQNIRSDLNTGGAAMNATRQLGSILGKPVNAPGMAQIGAGPNFSKVAGVPTMAQNYGPTDYSADRSKVEQAFMSRMNPMLQRAEQQRTAQLSNQGIKTGTEAYDREMNLLGQNANDAQMQAILAGGQEQSRLTGLARDAAQFGNDARQQSFGNTMAATGFNNAVNQQGFDNGMSRAGFNNDAALAGFGAQQQARTGAINEAAALRGGSQIQMPQFGGMTGPQMPNTDMGGLINNQYQGQLANWQQQQQARQGMLGGLFGLGAAGIMASDERLKEDIEPVGAEIAGNPVFEYSYKGDDTRHIGVMAQDVLKTRPEAVVPMGRYLAVDYRKLGVA